MKSFTKKTFYTFASAIAIFASNIAGAANLVVATDTSFVPFEFNQNGKYVGFDIDLLNALTKKIGVTYTLKPMDFDGIIPALQTKSIDLAIAGMTIKSERMKAVDFSYPYYKTSVKLLVRSNNTDIKSIADLKGKVVAVKTGTTSVDIAKQAGAKTILQFPNIDGAYLAVQAGQADASIYDAPNVLYFVKTAGAGKVKAVGPDVYAQTYGIAFPMGSDLRKKFDIALLQLIEDGEYANIYEHWFGTKPN
jgi:glutamine transport system substrate-binding protein